MTQEEEMQVEHEISVLEDRIERLKKAVFRLRIERNNYQKDHIEQKIRADAYKVRLKHKRDELYNLKKELK